MAKRSSNPLKPLAESDSLRAAARNLVKQVQDEASKRALSPAAYERSIKELERLRGRPLLNPALSSGAGQGARVRMADGTTKLDFIGGIGVYGFGHADPDLLETAVLAAATDVVFQGHLVPGPEYLRLSKALRRHAGPRLKHVWLSLSGAMANENALKMIYQKHAPADHIVVFEGGFHGRSAAMAELTDKPAFREGQPLHGNVLHVPFYDGSDPDSTAKSVGVLQSHLKRRPGRIGGMCFELIQGEGGFKTAPREFFVELMSVCRDAEIAVWVDEVQTFARTGELFATKSLELFEFVDLLTAGKTLQGSAVLFSKEYNPRPGLVAGTYAGNTVGMAVGARTIEKLEDEGYLGPEGRVHILGRRIEKRFESLRKKLPKAVGPRSGVGAMQAFVPFDGSPDVVRAVLSEAYQLGLILLSTGSLPMKIRMLPPVNTTDEELESAFSVLERALSAVAEARGLPC
jgi:4-aminobutyrate aminotransferase-like enzyme